MGLPIAVQLYTVRDCLKADFAGTLKKVADLGYTGVELAGLYGQSASEVRVLLDALGLTAVGAHIGIDALKSDIQGQIADAQALGHTNIIVPWIGNDYRNEAGYRQLAKMLDEFAGPVTDAGMTLGYHNHAFEFETLADGSCGFDILINETDPAKVSFELDLYWVTKGGRSAYDFAAALAGRVCLLHIKDMADTPEQGFAEVGTGTIDYQPIVNDAASWGAQALVIEQDSGWIDGDPIKSISISMANFKPLVA